VRRGDGGRRGPETHATVVRAFGLPSDAKKTGHDDVGGSCTISGVVETIGDNIPDFEAIFVCKITVSALGI